MKNFSIPKEQWIEVYNSITLLLYFMYEYRNNAQSHSIDVVNKRYNDFCENNDITGENFHFEGGANMLSFCYLIIVRVYELVNMATGSNGKATYELFRLIFNQSECDSFDKLKDKYEMQIITFPNDKQSDAVKLYRLLKHLRHSVSHYNYEIADDSVHFKSINSRNNTVELDMSMPMAQLLNLIADFGTWLNNTLHDEDLLTAHANADPDPDPALRT